jgi:hypothetical protein
MPSARLAAQRRERRAGLELLAELGGLAAQLLVRQRPERRLVSGRFADDRLVGLQQPFVTAAEDAREDIEHARTPGEKRSD